MLFQTTCNSRNSFLKLNFNYIQCRMKTIRTNEARAMIQQSPTVNSTAVVLSPEDINRILPFSVTRQSSGMLPIYKEYMNGRTRVITRIKKINGDVNELAILLAKFIPKERIQLKANQSALRLNGDYVWVVREVLTQLKM